MDSDTQNTENNTDQSSANQEVTGQANQDAVVQGAPADALSRTPEELEQDQTTAVEAANGSENSSDQPAEKKLSAFKRIYRKVNLYFLLFGILVTVAGVITAVNYLNSRKVAPKPDIASQSLTEEELKQLATKDATVGNPAQTLTIQGNAVIAGQTLMRGNLNVAGNLQTGGSIQGPSLTISGTSNLGETQINNLQVATNTAVQGTTTLRDLNVAGTSSFSGAITASQLTVSRLIMSGNAVLQIPNHISFTGPSPSHSINGGVLGNGGSASIQGSDTAGTVNVNTGNNPSAGCFVQITFHQQFTSQPRIVVSPVGLAAGQSQYYVTRTNAGFSICTANAAPANQVFAFDYFITN